MVIAFENLFNRQYEGGANWLEISLYSLGLTPDPPRCLVLGARTESLPETIREAPHVTAVPFQRSLPSKMRRVVAGVARRITRRPWEDRGLTELASQYEIDLWVGFTGFEGLSPRRALLVWYPDFQFRHLPAMFSDKEIRDRERQWNFVAERANGIVAISESVARDALSTHPQIIERLYVLPFPPLFTGSHLSMQPEAAREKYNLPNRFFLVCNQFWTHKNHKLVLGVLDLLRTQRVEPPVVVFTGRPYDYRNPDSFSEILNYVNHHGLHDYCRFLGIVPRHEQLALIRAAAAVIHPSLFEGRGAIVEEAHVLGAQVLCSDLPVHRELHAPGTLFFPTDGVRELAELMQRQYGPSRVSTQAIIEESDRRVRQYGLDFLRVCLAAAGSAHKPAAASVNASLQVELNES